MSTANLDKPIRRRRWPLVLACSLAVVGVTLAVLIANSNSARWNGYKNLKVIVLVADADALNPLPGVPVTVFRGVWDPFASRMEIERLGSSHEGDPRADVQRLTTGENGIAEFVRRFRAGGSDNSGIVMTDDTWIEVAPPGYGAVSVPLGRPSAHGEERRSRRHAALRAHIASETEE